MTFTDLIKTYRAKGFIAISAFLLTVWLLANITWTSILIKYQIDPIPQSIEEVFVDSENGFNVTVTQ
jgi:hypothetical protein